MTTTRRRPSRVHMLVALLYDPDGRSANVQLVIEGPFADSSAAVRTLKSIVRRGRFSLADTQVIGVSSAKAFYASMQDIKSVLKSAISPR